MAPVAFQHAGQGEMHPVDDTAHVDGHFPVFCVQTLTGEFASALNPRVVDQHAQWPGFIGLLQKTGKGIRVGYVQMNSGGAR